MVRGFVTALALITVAAGSASAARPRFTMTLAVATDGGEYFGTTPALVPRARRLYPGESLQFTLTGRLRNADTSGLSNTVLASELNACIVPGDLESELSTTAAHTCGGVTGISWQIAPGAGDWTVSATVTAVAPSIPAGTYTVFVVLPNATVTQRLGAYAPEQLRSNSVRVVVGPPTTSDDALNAQLHAAFRAEVAEDYSAERTAAESILASYSSSVLALCYLGDAKAGLGDTAGAIAAYEAALQIIGQGTDTRTPALSDPQERETKIHGIQYALAELRGELGPQQ